MNAFVLPHWLISAVSVVPGGAYPSYAHGCYARDNASISAGTRSHASARASSNGWSSTCSATRDHAQLLQQAGSGEHEVRAAYSADEMMTVTAARQLRDGCVCFVGIGLPSAACNLARLTHAPELVLIYESGTVGTRPPVLPLSIGDGELAETATCVVPLPRCSRSTCSAGAWTWVFSARRRSIASATSTAR